MRRARGCPLDTPDESLHPREGDAKEGGKGSRKRQSRSAPIFSLGHTRRLTTMESCSMFMFDDMENFFRLRSFAASIAALLWGGDGSLCMNHRRVCAARRRQRRPTCSRCAARA